MNAIQKAAKMICRTTDGRWMVDPHVIWGYPDDMLDHSAVIVNSIQAAWEEAIQMAKPLDEPTPFIYQPEDGLVYICWSKYIESRFEGTDAYERASAALDERGYTGWTEYGTSL